MTEEKIIEALKSTKSEIENIKKINILLEEENYKLKKENKYLIKKKKKKTMVFIDVFLGILVLVFMFFQIYVIFF